MLINTGKKIAFYFGSFLVIVSLVFIGNRLLQHWHQLETWSPDNGIWIVTAIGVGSVAYGLVSFFLASAWRQLLISLIPDSLDAITLQAIYARSQIAKYIPGNIMHFAGRHVMTRKLGLAHKPIATSTFCEILGLLLASGTIATLGSTVYGFWNEFFSTRRMIQLIIGVLTVAILIKFFESSLLKRLPVLKSLINHTALHFAFIGAYGKYLLFFILTGTILLALTSVISGAVNFEHAVAIITTFAVAWIAGFITPGAPSGIGIRESIMTFSLDKILATHEGVIIAVLFRIITVLGDVLFLLFAGRHQR